MRFITWLLIKPLSWLARFSFAVGFATFLILGLYSLTLLPDLPSITDVEGIELKVPLRIYSNDDQLIAEFGDERRQPVTIKDVPAALKFAILAAEDARFYDHIGVDFLGVGRAVLANLRSGAPGQGASTITMQVARNFFLTREKTYDRKLKEVLLAFRLEKVLTKDQILELYLNKIFLGHRAYGFAAAAKVYYARDLTELTIPQIAMLAGLPKAPSTTNPLTNPKRAKTRRDYVLSRMRDNGWLEKDATQVALDTPVSADHHATKVDVKSPFVAEEIRKCVIDYFGSSAYSSGLRIYTTIDPELQAAASNSVRNGIVAYETRHGWRGPVATLDLATFQTLEQINDRLNEEVSSYDLKPAMVLSVTEKSALMLMAGSRNHPRGQEVEVPWEGLSWARRFETTERLGPEITRAGDILKSGMIVYVQPDAKKGHWRLSQLPSVSSALVSMDPATGAIRSMVGGFDYYLSKFNRVTQAERQPGSNIKPFIYSAAIDRDDVTAATVISGAPLTISNSEVELPWRPENYSGKFVGPTRLRQALAKSLNLVSVRLLKHVGTRYTRNYLERFGFDRNKLPNGLPLALGATSVTPIELASGYTAFANGGYRVKPHLISRVEDGKGNVIDWNELLEARFKREETPTDASASPSTDSSRVVSKKDEVISFDSEDSSNGADPAANTFENSICRTMQYKVCPNCTTAEDSADINVDEATGYRFEPARRVISPQTTFLMRSLMNQVVTTGTGNKAKKELGRNDLAGKTGTTNDFNDAWFSGFSTNVITTVWFGFDQPRSLGRGESGARAALPVWIDYMRTALAAVPESVPPVPPGIVERFVHRDTGLSVSPTDPNAFIEYFKESNAPDPVGVRSLQPDSRSLTRNPPTTTSELPITPESLDTRPGGNKGRQTNGNRNDQFVDRDTTRNAITPASQGTQVDDDGSDTRKGSGDDEGLF